MEQPYSLPRIEMINGKKLAGKCMLMSFADNRTHALWSGFMPIRKTIKNAIGTDLYSVQRYTPLFFENFNPQAAFEKWATIEVGNFEDIPEEMETLEIPPGLYAVFEYKGAASAAADMFRYIFGQWFPESGYVLDNRPHFEVLGAKYKNEDPESEEEIWIPVNQLTINN